MDSSGHTDISDVRASASGSNDVFDDDLGLPAKPDALGKNFAHLSRDEGRDLNLESFVVLSKIAEGAFGKVVLARKKRTAVFRCGSRNRSTPARRHATLVWRLTAPALAGSTSPPRPPSR